MLKAAAGLPSTSVKSLAALDKCQGLILSASKGRTSWMPWLETVIQELAKNRTFTLSFYVPLFFIFIFWLKWFIANFFIFRHLCV